MSLSERTMLDQLPRGLYSDDTSSRHRKDLEIFASKLDEAVNSMSDLELQFNVQTATWSLRYYEEALGLKVDLEKPLDQRRSRIISKMRGLGTVTVSLIKTVAESYINGRVEITEHFADYYFVVRFIDELGVPPNIQDLKDAIADIKPAHLAVVYEFTYTLWGDLVTSNRIWGELATAGLIWGQLKTFKV